MRPIVRRLSSGYWRVTWSPEIWAQWPVWRVVHYEDFFNPEWTCTGERVRACAELTTEGGPT